MLCAQMVWWYKLTFGSNATALYPILFKVQFLVKPVTEGEGRCRFADLPGVRPYTGAATVFMSHW